MTSPLAITDLDRLVTTRLGLQAVAEHVLAKARYVDDGSIRLEAYGHGFATPVMSGGRRLSVDGVEIVVEDGSGSRRQRIDSVGRAAAFVGVEPGYPTSLQPAARPLSPDAPLDLDVAGGKALGVWVAFAAKVLSAFTAEIVDVVPSPLVLWPEHFDLAFSTEDAVESRRANYGASPGDSGHPEPYLYVGPWGAVPSNDYWNAPTFNGAVMPLSALIAADVVTDGATDAAMAFLRAGRTLLTMSS